VQLSSAITVNALQENMSFIKRREQRILKMWYNVSIIVNRYDDTQGGPKEWTVFEC